MVFYFFKQILIWYITMNHDCCISNNFLLFIQKEVKWKFHLLSQHHANSEINSSNHVITSIQETFIIIMLSKYMYFTTHKFYT